LGFFFEMVRVLVGWVPPTYMPVTRVVELPTVEVSASYGHEYAVVWPLAYKVLPSGLRAIPWLSEAMVMICLDEAKQPSAPSVYTKIPLPFCTTTSFPALSKSIPRGFVKPPATLTTFQPSAVVVLNRAAVTPEHEAGRSALAPIVAAEANWLVLAHTAATKVVRTAEEESRFSAPLAIVDGVAELPWARASFGKQTSQ